MFLLTLRSRAVHKWHFEILHSAYVKRNEIWTRWVGYLSNNFSEVGLISGRGCAQLAAKEMIVP